MLQYSFTKTHEIDKDKFAELVIAAQGCRSLRSFADACGVYASTLTRIIQKENKGASSPELLEAIAKNADSKSGVTIDVLADANGYSIKYILNQKHNTESSQFVKISKAVIAAALLDRGAVARFENTCRNISAYSICDEYYARPDIHILTDSFECNTTDWLICAVCFSPSHIFDKADMRNIFTKISEFSALSVNKRFRFSPETTYFSLVVNTKSAYDFILSRFKHLLVPSTISVILIDQETNSIVDEFMPPHVTHGHRPGYFVTTEPVINHQSSELYEDDFERRCNNEGNP